MFTWQRTKVWRVVLGGALSLLLINLNVGAQPPARRPAAPAAAPARADVPIGTVLAYAGKTPPAGYLLCNGQEVQVSQYRRLYDLIGTVYGGDGATRFRVPNLNGRTIVGVGQGQNLTARTLGATGGEEGVTLTVEQMPSHAHTQTLDDRTGAAGGPNQADGNGGTETTGVDNGRTRREGGGQPHNNMPPFIALNYIIKY